jgi:fatty acid kinase fatty acid binding subunit
MMIKIIADTLSCISPDSAIRIGIDLLPQYVIFGETTYRDDTEIDAQKFLRMATTSRVFPTTAAPAPILYKPIFEKINKDHDIALVISPSAKVSGTFQSVEKAACEFPGTDIRIVDTQLLAAGLGTVVKEAKKWIDSGLGIDQVIERINSLAAKNRTYVLVDTLEFLKRGGRIGAASALIGGLLDMKPILAFRNGQIEPIEKQRTKKKAIERMKDLVLTDCAHGSSTNLVIMHGDVISDAEKLADEFQEILGLKDIPIIYPPSAILVHSGPGMLAVSYFTD